MIEVQGLTRRYSAHPAVQNISFKVEPGEVVGLLGPNGAGKSTILRMLLGLTTPQSGQVKVCGIDPQQDPFEVKRRVGYFSGDAALYPRLTPRENLLTFGKLQGMATEAIQLRIEQLAEDFELGRALDQKFSALPIETRQRANLARALMHDPPVLLLDDPTSALDLLSERFLFQALVAASAARKAILFATQALGEAEYLCDRVILIHRGRILESGTVEQVRIRMKADSLSEAFLRRIDGVGTNPSDLR